LRGIEAATLERQVPPLLEQWPELCGERRRAFGQHGGIAFPDQQRVVENAAQARQGRAHCRLRDAQMLGRPRNVGAAHQRFEVKQEVDVRNFFDCLQMSSTPVFMALLMPGTAAPYHCFIVSAV
jgi:hypothetical protein